MPFAWLLSRVCVRTRRNSSGGGCHAKRQDKVTSASCAVGRSRHQTLSCAALLTPTESPARASASPRLSAHGRSQHGISEESAASGGQSCRPARGGASDSWAQDPVGTRLWTGQQAALGTEVDAVGAGGVSRWGAPGGRRGLSVVPAFLSDGSGGRGLDGRPRRPVKAEGPRVSRL